MPAGPAVILAGSVSCALGSGPIGERLSARAGSRPPINLTEVVAARSRPEYPGGACPQLALDDVVNLHPLWLAGFDSDLGENRHQLLAECVELLLGVPDLTDVKVAIGTEADVVFKTVSGEAARLLKLADALVVLCRVNDAGAKRIRPLIEFLPGGLRPTLSPKRGGGGNLANGSRDAPSPGA